MFADIRAFSALRQAEALRFSSLTETIPDVVLTCHSNAETGEVVCHGEFTVPPQTVAPESELHSVSSS